MRRLILWIPAPVGIFAIMFLGLLLLIVAGIPFLLLMLVTGVIALFAFVWALLCLIGVAAGHTEALVPFFTALATAAGALTISSCVFYYGEKLLRIGKRRPRYALTLRDESFNG